MKNLCSRNVLVNGDGKRIKIFEVGVARSQASESDMIIVDSF